MGLEVNRMAFYNLQRKESEGQLSDQDQARMILGYLEAHKFHVEIDESYVYDGAGNIKERCILAIGWFS
jgi:hypothetical protein